MLISAIPKEWKIIIRNEVLDVENLSLEDSMYEKICETKSIGEKKINW